MQPLLPIVAVVLPGCRDVGDLKQVLTYFDESEKKNYDLINNNKINEDSIVKCVYCSHCQPCPQNLDIALINKYYDLSVLGDELAYNHYKSLDIKASHCIDCKKCDSLCPFNIYPSKRIKDICKFFGE